MKKALLLLSICLFPAVQSYSQTLIKQITVGSFVRDYRLYVPPVYDGFYPVPLVINLHGKTSSASQHDAMCKMNLIADTANFILIHPNGYPNSKNVREWWTTTSPTGIDDIAFIDALINDVVSQYNIDLNRVYIVGFSNGAFMTYTLASQLSHRIAAICANAGGMTFPLLNALGTVHPMPLLNMHGTADPLVPFTGTAQYPSADSLVKRFASFNGCNMTPTTTAIPNTNLTDNSTADRKVYSGGLLGSTVEFITIYGGQHSWPGTNTNVRGVTCRDFNAGVEAWKFFSRFSLDQFGGGFLAPINNNSLVEGISNETKTNSSLTRLSKLESISLNAYPNPCNNELKINIPRNININMNEVSVYNVYGVKMPIFVFSIEDEELNIVTTSWPDGIYYMKISSKNLIGHQKIVKKSN
jgi:polyhydroxybutyrate depolymerase